MDAALVQYPKKRSVRGNAMSPKRLLLTLLVIVALGTIINAASATATEEIVERSERLSGLTQTTVTLDAVADATVRQWDADTNFGEDPSLELAYKGDDEEAATLIRFDLSSLPPDAVIDAAYLRLYLEGATGADPVTINAYFVTSSWDESTVTWDSDITTGEWALYADIDAAVGSYKSWDISSYAQSWVGAPGANYGVLLRGPTDGTYYERWFESLDHGEYVPQLEVTYHVPSFRLSGRVYEGEVGDETDPLSGVTVSAYGANDPYPVSGTLLVTATTDIEGWYGLDVPEGYEYYHIRQTDLSGYTSVGATSVDGTVRTANWIEYLAPLDGKTLTGNKFWDQFSEDPPDLIVTTIWPEGTYICFVVQNIGSGVAPAGHQTTLSVDGVEQGTVSVAVDLASMAMWEGCFDYTWVCSGESDAVVVRADATDVVAESDETNNRREENWDCALTPPEIVAGPTTTDLTATSAVISWETDEPADSVVRYDSVARLLRLEETDPTLTTNHQVTLAGLTPSTTYHYVVRSTDPAGNAVESQDFLFETLPAADTQDPIVDLRAPTVMTGTVTIRADAEDDTGLEKVEFYLNDDLVFTDYSPPYEWVFLTEDKENGDYALKAKAFDLFGNATTDQMTVPVDNFVDAETPTVNIFFPAEGADVYGDTRVWVTVSDDSGWSEVEWFVDGNKMGGGQYPVSPSLDVMFWWDTTYFSPGSHSLAVQATDGDGKVGTDLITVNVANAGPPPSPKLVVTEQEVFRHAHTFAIELTVQNKGQATASEIEVTDALRGFQPIARTFNDVTYETDFDTTSMQATAIIKDPVSLSPGASRTYVLAAVPVLIHDKPPVPSIGTTIQLAYKGSSGTSYQESHKFEALKTTETAGSAPSEPLGTAHTNAVGEADYLIVTNPSFLSFHNPFQDIEPVLSDMAELAFTREGALGYLRMSDRSTLSNLILPSGDWGQKLDSAFRTAAEGYLLIVGETEIVPAWLETHWNITWSNWDCHTREADISDLPYADTGGSNAAPELVVGRIIGNDAADLSAAIRASLDGSFDRSHYLLVSGTDAKSSIQDKFTGSVDEIEKAINCTDCVTKLHWKDITSSQRVSAFRNNTNDKDVVLYQGHGSPDGWGPLNTTHLQSVTQPISFGSTNPIVLGWACLTGSYEDHTANWDPVDGCTFDGGDDNIAEAFFDRGAAIYIGSTEVSAISHNRAGSKALFDKYWTSGTTIGKAFTELKRKRWSSSSYAQLWVYEYNLYGDPKYGVVSAGSAAYIQAQSDEQASSPVSFIDVVVPDYEVTLNGDVHEVDIPGGDLLLDPGDYRIPIYRETLTYPPGYEIQDVLMTERSAMSTDTGLNLPLNEALIAPPAGGVSASSGGAAGWTPEAQYDWEVMEDPDGTVTLIITMYPFYYDPATTDIEFYKNYGFDIDYTLSPVTITAMSTNQNAYAQGEPVQAEISLQNAGAAQDVSVMAIIKKYPSGEPAAGLALQTLSGLTGAASFAPVWDTEGFDPGGYYLEVMLKNAQNQVLDRSTRMFHLGIASGQVSSLTVAPRHFDIGDTINTSLVFENNGSVDLTGTAVVKIRDKDSNSVQEFKQTFIDLAPGETVTLDADWDTAGAARGSYEIVGYALYNGMATEAKTTMVSTDWLAIYLPIVYRFSP